MRVAANRPARHRCGERGGKVLRGFVYRLNLLKSGVDIVANAFEFGPGGNRAQFFEHIREVFSGILLLEIEARFCIGANSLVARCTL